MAGLTCSLSPVVYAELYRLLLASPAYCEEIIERLTEINCDEAWLQNAADEYDARWLQDAPNLDIGSADDYGLPAEHAVVATWLLASLRNTGGSYDLSSDLTDAVQCRVDADAPRLATRTQSLSPVIRGWTLGMVAGRLAPSLPMVLAYNPEDPDITEAYDGLVEQVLHLATATQPWPELAGTALYVRAGGLAEALRPPPEPVPGERKKTLWDAIQSLMRETKPQTPLHIFSRMQQNWIGWVSRRNVLTHITAGEDGQRDFTAGAAQVRTWYDLEITVLAITQFVCQEVSLELQSTIPPALRGQDPWEYLQYDVKIWY